VYIQSFSQKRIKHPSKTKKKALTFVLSAIEVTGFPLLSTRSVPYAIAFTSVLIVFLIDFAFCNIFLFFQIRSPFFYLNLYLCFFAVRNAHAVRFCSRARDFYCLCVSFSFFCFISLFYLFISLSLFVWWLNANLKIFWERFFLFQKARVPDFVWDWNPKQHFWIPFTSLLSERKKIRQREREKRERERRERCSTLSTRRSWWAIRAHACSLSFSRSFLSSVFVCGWSFARATIAATFSSSLRLCLCLSRFFSIFLFSDVLVLLYMLFIIISQSNTSVYVGVIIAGALVGEKMVNKGFDSMWESRNKGKLFKDLKLPDAEE